MSVLLCEQPIGILQLNSGSMSFSYKDAQRALSLSMPVRSEPYKNRACEAFFGALLPDNSGTRQIIARNLGMHSNSSFSLLTEIGFDCAGAVSLRPIEKPLAKQNEWFELEGKSLTEEDLFTLLKDLPTKPLLAGVDGIRISLGGAQNKAALCLINNEIGIPGTNIPTTHILKPSIKDPDIVDSVRNEYFCMTLAARIGLEAPNVQIRKAKDVEFLLIERFDREINSDTRIKRIHQEDFCQALGVVSTKKYQVDGGPTLKDCFSLLDRTTIPLLDKRKLLHRVIFNYVVGNADCHAKNFSLSHKDAETVHLTPVYDILCTAVYPKLTTKFAMSIGGEYDLNRISRENWIRFCSDQANVNIKAFKNICLELCDGIVEQSATVSEEMRIQKLWNATMEKIADLVRTRARELKESAVLL
ncbi:MAG: type II toxin-antitoxin system HipA family toxin [Candidatus Obscuribacterales bacterium]|nr:type II toxin-antitoxin system HipA family toxin [Candidatus Obscuribacterales bacterium]